MKKLLCLLLVIMLLLPGCNKPTRTVTCDGCGAQILVEESSNITDEWILFCNTCQKDLPDEIK